jgi:hypothetical protein
MTGHGSERGAISSRYCGLARHAPPSVLGKNCGVPSRSFGHTPDPGQRYIFPLPVPEPLGVAPFTKSWDELIASITGQIEKAGATVMPSGAVKPGGGSDKPSATPATGAPRSPGGKAGA